MPRKLIRFVKFLCFFLPLFLLWYDKTMRSNASRPPSFESLIYGYLVGLLGRGHGQSQGLVHTQDITNRKKRRHMSMPRLRFELSMLVFKRKSLHALGRVMTVTGVVQHSSDISIKIFLIIFAAFTAATSDEISCHV
jgi:hypothetical protein